MWRTAAAVFAASGVAALILTQVVRSIVDRHRVRTRGVGGTQDIAFCGIIVTSFCVVAWVLCSLMWLVSR